MCACVRMHELKWCERRSILYVCVWAKKPKQTQAGTGKCIVLLEYALVFMIKTTCTIYAVMEIIRYSCGSCSFRECFKTFSASISAYTRYYCVSRLRDKVVTTLHFVRSAFCFFFFILVRKCLPTT